ncbi:MAG TPA: VWA domain-containing protein [Pyrinomonadaceae bacterium]|nr:VWA domain-containing protein [Pyrinomonadaceae bacterium]
MPPPPSTAPRRALPTPKARALRLRILLLTLLAHLCAADAPAQDVPPPPSPEEVVRVSTDLVTVPVYVTDGGGRRVAGLGREDFEVSEDGRRVEAAYFAAGAERVALLFLLDASGSTRETIARQRETALAVFNRFGPGSRVAVMQFRERPELTLPFTADASRAPAAFLIEALPDRRTAIFDAALAAVRAFAAGPSHPAERRIVVLISDGLDTASAARASTVVGEAERAGVSFYVIHLPLYAPREGRLVARRPAKDFRALAEKTGGQFFVVGDARTSLDAHAAHDLGPVFRAIAEDLAGQYVLGYHASETSQGPGPRRLEVRLTAPNRRKLRLRQLRHGYRPEARP